MCIGHSQRTARPGMRSTSASSRANKYVQIVRWNGAYNNWTELNGTSACYAKNGDVVKATIVGSTITVYLNGSSV